MYMFTSKLVKLQVPKNNRGISKIEDSLTYLVALLIMLFIKNNKISILLIKAFLYLHYS